MKIISYVLLVSTVMMGGGLALAQSQAYSDYTTIDFDDKQCRTIEDDNPIVKQYPSFANYQVNHVAGDNGAQLSVSYGEHGIYVPIMPLGSSLGKKAEWRYRMVGNKRQYHGLIFRTFKMRDEDYINSNFDVPRIEELVVVRLNKEKTCILDILPVGKDVNKKARQLADDMNAICSLEYN